MNFRTIAILNEKENAISNTNDILNALMQNLIDADLVVFTKFPEKFNNDKVKIVKIPDEKNNRPKMKNFVIRHLKDNGINGFLHVLEDKIKINASPRLFIEDIEHMMQVYDLNCWFDTITDTCNYVYSKYNPRLDIVIDNPEYANNLKIQNAVFCSHSNVQWTIYNISRADDDELYFNEDFDIDMFFIIEFLARRRNTHPGSLYFMNQYFTCSSEIGVFEINNSLNYEEQSSELQEKMKKDDAIFKSMNINYSPDNNIDKVLEILYEKLRSKNEEIKKTV